MAELPAPDGSRRRVPAQYRLVYEPLETLSYVAALTERVRLGTSVIDALLHPPVVLARRFATLDQLSGGRVVAGLGQGWMPQEFETANVPMDRIGSGMDEVVAAMRACWGPDPVEFEGRFYRIAPSEVNPKPVQERIPVLLGATTPAGARRAGRIADGRNPAGLTVVVRANVPLSREPLGDGRPFLGGSPGQIAEDLARLEPAGVDEVLFSSIAASDLETEVGLLAELRVAVAATA